MNPSYRDIEFACPNDCRTYAFDTVPWSCAKCGAAMKPHGIKNRLRAWVLETYVRKFGR